MNFLPFATRQNRAEVMSSRLRMAQALSGRAAPTSGSQRSRNKGHARRAFLTAAGTVGLDRLYLVCPGCGSSHYPLDRRPDVGGFVSPRAQRLLCLAGANWSFDQASANLAEFCGLEVCDNTIRSVCHAHGGAMRG